MTSFAARLAEARPEEVAIRDEVRQMSWAEVDDVLNRVANGLNSVDLGGHRRVAVFAENAVETAMANLGGLIAGASVVPVNFHLTAEEVAYILQDAGVAVLFCDGITAERALQAAEAAGVALVIGWHARAAGSGLIDWDAWLAQQSAAPADESRRPLPNLLYTSGTTGRPKGTELPPTMFAGGDTVAEHLANLAQDPRAERGVHMVVGPMYHTGPLSGARLLAAGVSSVILGKFDAEKNAADH